jgi:hypothetical protein
VEHSGALTDRPTSMGALQSTHSVSRCNFKGPSALARKLARFLRLARNGSESQAKACFARETGPTHTEASARSARGHDRA